MATGATVNYSLPYPLPTDQVDVAGDIEQLVTKIDNDLQEIIEDKTAAMFTGATVSNGFTLPVYNDATGKMTLTLAQDIQTSASPTFASLNLNESIVFEGATADAYETTLTVVDPTADRTITLPNVTGTVITTGDSGSITSAMILNGTIVDEDINASAAIVDTKLATISTAGKVSNSATTATNDNTSSAIVARDASGNFSAGTITASLTGTASKATNMTGGNSTTLLGSIGYQSNTDTTTLLSPNTTTTKKFLRQTGDGTNGAVPAWDTLVNGDIPSALSGKTYEGVTISSSTGTFTLTNSKTFAVQNSITLSGTDSTTITLPATTGTVALNNQTMYIGTTSVAINRSSANIGLTGISSVAFPGSSSGTSTLQAPSVAGTATITLPSSTGTLALTSDLSSYAALSGATFTGTVIAVTPTTSLASIRLPHGSDPTSPTDGDIWTTSAGIYVQINGATVGPLGTGSGGGGGGTASLQDILMFAGM